jgi:DNA repair photolyase
MRVEYRIEPCRSALTQVKGMPFKWSLNPYMGCVHRCTFCYVRHFEKRADRPSDDRYGRSIRVKPNVADVLRRELARASWQRDGVAMGTATDPYQPAEGRFELTRACIRELAASGTPFSIVTRGPLVVRDVDLLADAAREVSVAVYVSLPTLDERVWRTTEPGTAPPASRLRAISVLADTGIEVGVGMAPILPGLTDRPEQLAEVVRAAREAGATGIWANLLYLRPGTKEHFLEALARDWPEERERYEELYASGAYVPRAQVDEVKSRVRELAREHAIRDRRAVRLAPPPEPVQLTLAV